MNTELDLRPLFPHQQRMLEYATPRDRVAFFVEMRLGKTPVAIRWARAARRVLVVAPLTVLGDYGWCQELRLEGVARVHRLFGLSTKQRRAYFKQHPFEGWYLINYEGLRVCPWILGKAWDVVICDESTKIRNPQAQITKLLTRATTHVDRKAILTGLPNPESALDYFAQMQFLHGEFLGQRNFWEFRHKYFHEAWMHNWVPNKTAVDTIKKEVHRLAFILTRKQAGIGNKKLHQVRTLTAPPDVRRLQKKITKDFAFDNSFVTKWAPVQQIWLSKLAGGFSPDNELLWPGKLNELVSIVTEDLRDDPVVVWFRFNHEIRAAYDYLTDAGVRTTFITGKTKVDERSRIQGRFQRGKVQALLMQEKCGQYGLNLSCASTAIYYSNWWDHEVRAQSEDRIEHMTKAEPLLYIDLATENTVDMAVLAALREKRLTARVFNSRLISELKKLWSEDGHSSRSTHGVKRQTTSGDSASLRRVVRQGAATPEAPRRLEQGSRAAVRRIGDDNQTGDSYGDRRRRRRDSSQLEFSF